MDQLKLVKQLSVAYRILNAGLAVQILLSPSSSGDQQELKTICQLSGRIGHRVISIRRQHPGLGVVFEVK
jgi:hypothetical protein